MSDTNFPPPPPAPPSPYGSPYGEPQGGEARPHPQSTTVLILGILSLVVCGLMAPVAWWMGAKARREVRESQGAYRETSELKAGWIMGIIGSVLLVLGVIFFLLFFVFAIAVGSQAHCVRSVDGNGTTSSACVKDGDVTIKDPGFNEPRFNDPMGPNSDPGSDF